MTTVDKHGKKAPYARLKFFLLTLNDVYQFRSENVMNTILDSVYRETVDKVFLY